MPKEDDSSLAGKRIARGTNRLFNVFRKTVGSVLNQIFFYIKHVLILCSVKPDLFNLYSLSKSSYALSVHMHVICSAHLTVFELLALLFCEKQTL